MSPVVYLSENKGFRHRKPITLFDVSIRPDIHQRDQDQNELKSAQVYSCLY